MLGLTNSSNAPSVVLKDTVVSTWYFLPSTGTDSDMKTQGYTYYSSISATGVTANTIAEVTFSDAQAKSGNYAPICRTYADEIRVYSKVNTSITVPSIIIHSIVENYYEMDNSPVNGSTNPITSGGAYDAIMTATFNHKRTFSSMADLISFASNLNKVCYLRCSHLASGYDYWNLGVMLAPSSSSVAWYYTASFGLYRPWNNGDYGAFFLPLFAEVGTTSIGVHIFPLFTTTSSEQISYVPVEYCELYY